MSDPIYGPQVKRPVRVRVLQVASLVLAVAGLILLYLYSVHREIPTVRVIDITPTMNFAYVKISGDVTRNAYLFKSGGVVFNVHDGSGEIAILGGRAQAEALKKSGKLPRVGDRVDVAGSLSVSADQDVKLRLQSVEQLTLKRRPKTAEGIPTLRGSIPLSDITPAQRGDTVSVVGMLKKTLIPKPGSKAPYVLILEEDGAELRVIFWDEVFQGLEHTLPTLGKLLRARGRVDIYKGAIQLKVWEASDLREVSELEGIETISEISAPSERLSPPIELTLTGREGLSRRPARLRGERAVRIADITADQQGERFTVVGMLGEPTSIRGGVIYPIVDDSGEMIVLFWDKQVSGEERDALESGVRLRVTAPLVVYKGELELIPEDAGSFQVEAAE